MGKKSKERGYEMRKGQLIDYLFSGMTISMQLQLFCQLFMMLIFTMKRSVDLKKGGGGHKITS